MKDLCDPAYWDRFGRHALAAEDRPTPREAADAVLQLMRERNDAVRELAEARRDALASLSALRAPLMEAANRVDDEVAAMAARWRVE